MNVNAMPSFRTVLAIAATAGLVACGGPALDEGEASSAVKAITNAWTFAKLPPTRTNIAITAPVQALEMFSFEMGVTDQRGTRVTAVAFQVMGTSPVGTLSNYQLVYFADGLKKPGTVIGTNTGATWVPGSSPIVSIPLTTPLTLPRNFKGEFALLVDVTGGVGTFFTAQLQTVTMDAGAGEVYVTDTCDLPLGGDTFYIN